ncbi:EamA family transporter, partial [Pseudomonas sp. MWU13-2625]
MLATSLVLAAALLHAAWNTLIKFSGERLLVVTCMDTVALLFVAIMLFFLEFPPLEIWPWII